MSIVLTQYTFCLNSSGRNVFKCTHSINKIPISEEEEEEEKKGLDKPDSKSSKKGKDDDDDDDDDLPSLFKRKIPIHVQSMPKGRQNGSRRASKVVDNEDDDDDVFTKTLSKMKESRGRSNIGVKKTSFSSYGQSPHPGSRRK